jgi:uncharacterized protein (DUF2236 family)
VTNSPGPRGPSATIVQRRATDVRLFGAGGYALALQLGHPTIAAGVRDHSNFAADPWRRFFGTLDFVNLLVYGTPEQTARATSNLRAMHGRIRGIDAHGHRYRALEPSAYAWVHGTLGEAIVRGHHVFGTPLSARDKDEFWSEWRCLGAQLGVRDGDLPETWSAFQDYLRVVVDEVLEYSEMIDVAQNVAHHAPAAVVARWGAFLARGTMGARLRAKYRIPWSGRDQWTFARIAAAHRAARPVLPPLLRHAGPTLLRVRGRRIANGPFAA